MRFRNLKFNSDFLAKSENKNKFIAFLNPKIQNPSTLPKVFNQWFFLRWIVGWFFNHFQ